MNTVDKLREIIQDVLQIDPGSIDWDQQFVEYQNWDSMNYMLFIIEIERRFGIDLTNDEIVEMDNFNKGVELINKKLQTPL